MYSNMLKFDLKDRKILYQLNINSRQSFSQIGKKVGLSKTVVDYRIKKLEKQEIIRNYYTLIDAFKIGYEVLRFTGSDIHFNSKAIAKLIVYNYFPNAFRKKFGEWSL